MLQSASADVVLRSSAAAFAANPTIKAVIVTRILIVQVTLAALICKSSSFAGLRDLWVPDRRYFFKMSGSVDSPIDATPTIRIQLPVGGGVAFAHPPPTLFSPTL